MGGVAYAPASVVLGGGAGVGKQVYLLPGNPENIKITRPLDLAVAAAILRQREERNA